MYCKNCGKQINDNAKFCSFCGKMTDNVTVSVHNTNIKPVGYNSGKKLWPKNIAYIIGAAALAVIIISSAVLGISRFTRHFIARDDFHNNGPVEYYDYRNHRNSHPWDYFDNDDDDIFGGYDIYGGGQNGRGQVSPGASAQHKPTVGPWWSADENGRYPTDEGYKWPSGDGTYEYYINSTIPKFESVTGVELKKTETDNGSTYYTYELNDDAYKAYIKVLAERGFKQSEFEVKGQNSYEMYTLGDSSFYEYLVIYHMNSENKLIITA